MAWLAITASIAGTLPCHAQTGEVYLVIGSDTAIWNTPTTVDVYTRHPHYSQESFTSTNAPSYRVMDPTWRSQYLDSYQHPIKFTWWVMGGNIYRDADNLNVPTPNIMVLYLMRKYHGDAIRQFGDELSLHYHTFFWSDYNQDGVFHWNQSRTFDECRDDWDVTLAQYLLEEGVFPVSFRSGWHFMDADWQQCLNGLIPYSCHDDFGVFRAWYTNEPIAGVEDWSHAPSTFVPFHPSTNDYQVPGDSPGWNVRSVKMQNLTQAEVDYIFSQASNGADQVACFWSHLPENFVAMIAKTASLVQQASEKYPGVTFRYCTGVEAMQRWRGVYGQSSPYLAVRETETNQTITLSITTDKPIFQTVPFVAVKDAYRHFQNVSALCMPMGSNAWTIQLPVSRMNLAKVGVAVTDIAGNAATQILRYLPDDLYIDDLDPQYSESAATWTSTTNSAWGPSARVALLSPNETAQVRWLLPVATAGQYNIAAQVPPLTNLCTNVVFHLFAGGSTLRTVALPYGLEGNHWTFLCSAPLDPTVTNVLQMTVSGTNQPGTYAVADVIAVVPLGPSTGLPEQDQLAINPVTDGVHLQFRAAPGTTCEIQRSSNLGDWTTLDTLDVPLTGLLDFEDRHPPAGEAFYRVTSLSHTL